MGVGNQLAAVGRGMQSFNVRTMYLTAAIIAVAGVLLVAYNPQQHTPASGEHKSQTARLCGVGLLVLACFTVPITRYQYRLAHTSKTYAKAAGMAIIL